MRYQAGRGGGRGSRGDRGDTRDKTGSGQGDGNSQKTTPSKTYVIYKPLCLDNCCTLLLV